MWNQPMFFDSERFEQPCSRMPVEWRESGGSTIRRRTLKLSLRLLITTHRCLDTVWRYRRNYVTAVTVSKFYRLIEASLYGSISSAITRSLRDYLLPQNGGVKESIPRHGIGASRAVWREAIKTTQSDRDLFKHLITESTNYVAADYMRHANEIAVISLIKRSSM